VPDIRTISRAALTALVAACGPAGSAGGGPYPVDDSPSASAPWLSEDRIVIGDFSRVIAVAAGQERVWIVSPDAVLGWDHRFQRWDGPHPLERGGSLQQVQWALVDPLDQSLWLGHPGGWLHWQPDLRVWDGGTAPATVRGIFFDGTDPGSGLYLRTSSGWLVVPRGSGVATSSPGPARPVGPPTVQEGLSENPSFAVTSSSMLDERMRPVRITSAAESWDGRGWYFGTWGSGVLFVDRGFPTAQPLRYGLAGEVVGALFAAPGGVWVATDRAFDDEAALTFVGRELDRFELVTGNPATGLPFTAARAIIGHGEGLWVATDAGAVRIDVEDDRVSVVDESRGLPDSRVLALATRGDRIEAGTRHGLARIHTDSLRAETLARDEAGTISAVAVLRDTTWVGTSAGVRVLSAGGDALLMPAGLATASFSRPILQLAWAGDTLMALTRDGLFWRDAAGAWILGPDPTGLLGELGYMAIDADGVWLVGDAAIGFARPGLPALPVIRPDQIPGRVTGIAVDESYLWVGTTGGLVRFRIAAIRP
jgi:ligand-binding sensor domain-containing protein